MAFNLRNRSFVKELDFTPNELRFLLKLSADLRAAKYGGYEVQHLAGKNKSENRTSQEEGLAPACPIQVTAGASPSS